MNTLLKQIRNHVPVERLKNSRRTFNRTVLTLRELRDNSSELVVSARRGDVKILARLTMEGADLDAQGKHGRTLLHEAIRHGRIDAAAFLLAHGASHTTPDRDGYRAFDLIDDDLQLFHAIRQRYHRFQINEPRSTPSRQSQSWATELEDKGIVKVENLIGPNQLAQLRRDFESFISNIDKKLAQGTGVYGNYDEEEHFWAHDNAYVTNNAFKYSDQLVRICCDPGLVDAAQRYVGKPAFIQRGIGMRYLPSASSGKDMFGWHHDMEEKRLKVMILLSDVGESEQHMSYVLGSHKLFHPYRMFLRNPCPLEYVKSKLSELRMFSAVGEAGDVFLFDSNGAHRGNRNQNASTRDVFIVEYSGDPSEIWGGDVNTQLLDSLKLDGVNPFSRMLNARKKWELPYTRRGPSWIINLPHVERWLVKQ